MLLILLALTAATAAVRSVLDARIGELSASPRFGRAALVAIAVAVDRSDRALRSGGALGGLQGAADGRRGHRRRDQPAADRRQRSLPVLGAGAGRLRERPDRRRRQRRLHVVLARAPRHRHPGDARALAGLRDDGRARRDRARADPAASSGSPPSPASAAPATGPEGGAAAALGVLTVGFVASAVDWTWDLPAVFGATVVAAALLTGPATLAPLADAGPVGQSDRLAAAAALPPASRS